MQSRRRRSERHTTTLVLDEVEEGVSDLRLAVDPSLLELSDVELEIDGDVDVRLQVGRTLQMFSVSGSVHAALKGECCRCLAAARAEVDADVRFLLQRKEASEDEVEAVEEEDEVDIVDPGVKEVDLSERLHDALVLELPLRIYCKTDCQGLCPHCGQDLNTATCSCDQEATDPRWEALAQLKQATP